MFALPDDKHPRFVHIGWTRTEVMNGVLSVPCERGWLWCRRPPRLACPGLPRSDLPPSLALCAHLLGFDLRALEYPLPMRHLRAVSVKNQVCRGVVGFPPLRLFLRECVTGDSR